MIFHCVFKVFRTFWGIKYVRVKREIFPRGPFLAFFRPSRVLDQKMRLHPPPKRAQLVRGRIQSGLPLTWRDNPYPLTPGAGCDALVGQEFQDFQDWTFGLDFWTFRLDFWICRLDFWGFLASESWFWRSFRLPNWVERRVWTGHVSCLENQRF